MGKYMIELSSDIDEDTFFLVQTPSLKEQLEKVHPNKAVYLPYEIPFLKGISREELKAVHLMKKNFGGLILNRFVNKKSQIMNNNV